MGFFTFGNHTFAAIPDDLRSVSTEAFEEQDTAAFNIDVTTVTGDVIISFAATEEADTAAFSLTVIKSHVPIAIVGGIAHKPSIPKPSERKQIDEKFKKQRRARNPIIVEFYSSEEPDNAYFNTVVGISRRARQRREEEEIALFLLAA